MYALRLNVCTIFIYKLYNIKNTCLILDVGRYTGKTKPLKKKYIIIIIIEEIIKNNKIK
jgi:hypothetical protein